MKYGLLKKINLLYVEDDKNIRELLSPALKRVVKNLYVAKDGSDGYEQYVTHQPDIILTDIKMPRMSGLEMSKLIRETNNHIPIIVISAHSESTNFLFAIEMGITSYLLKPLDKHKLFSMLECSAKSVLYEKEQEEQFRIFQEVINLQPSIVFSSNQKKVLFANQDFLNFFAYDISLNELHENSETIYEALKNNPNITLEVNDKEHLPWIDYILKHPNKLLKVRINKDNKLYFFNLKTKEIMSNDEKSVIIVLNETL